MRLAYVCADPGVPVFGHKGCSIHVQEVVRAFVRRGAQVDLFATRVNGEPPEGLDSVRLHRLPPVPKADLAARERAAAAANADIRAALTLLGPFDLVYERHALWSFAAMEYAADLGAPGVLEVNAPLVEEQARYRGLADVAGAEAAARRAFAAAGVIVAVSDEVAAYPRLAGAPADRVHVIPNGVSPDRFRPGLPPALPPEPGTFTVGFVGSMKPWHGVDLLVAAFAHLHARAPRSRLLLVGEGGERPALEADVARRGLADAVRFTGAVPPERVPGLLASMDVATAPYPPIDRFYFSPLKAYEYLAAGLPVVASRVGPLAALVRDGENGLLCPPGDADALADALGRLERDAGLRARLGRAARAGVARDHTWDAVVDRVLRLAGRGLPTAAVASAAGEV